MAAIVAVDPSRVSAIKDRFVDLYDVRSDTVHEGELAVEPGFVYEAMVFGANVIGYIARSTLSDDATFHRHLDVMTSTGAVWIEYGATTGLDSGM